MIALSLSKFDRLTKKLQLFDLPFPLQGYGRSGALPEVPDGQALLREVEPKGLLGWPTGIAA